VPPDMVREDDKRMSDYYRRRRESRADAARPKMTREGDVIPDKNRDRRTTRQGASASTGSSARPNGDRDSSNVRPFGEGVRPFGEGVRPLGEGVRPLGEGVRPLGEGVRPFNEGVRPLGEGVRPMGEGVRPFGEGKPSIIGDGSRGRGNSIIGDGSSSTDGERRVADWASNALSRARRNRNNTNKPTTQRTGSADAQERRAEAPKRQITDSGSADTRERGIIRDDLARRGFDGDDFRNLMRDTEGSLEAGQDTNWNPGRLPRGGKISATGDYIPPSMVEEDDRRADNFYRNRRENRPNEPRITRDGTVVPDKNRDRIPPRNTTTRTGSADSMERNAPRAPRTGSADAQERRAEAEERRRTGKGQGFDKLETEEEVNAYRESYGLPPVNTNSSTSSTSRRPNISSPTTSEGDVLPNKNTDKRKPKVPSSLDNFLK